MKSDSFCFPYSKFGPLNLEEILQAAFSFLFPILVVLWTVVRLRQIAGVGEILSLVFVIPFTRHYIRDVVFTMYATHSNSLRTLLSYRNLGLSTCFNPDAIVRCDVSICREVEHLWSAVMISFLHFPVAFTAK